MLEVAAFVVLAAFVNLLSAVLALAATLFYVFVYTLWLKRTSTQNIVIGGAAGAVPVLVGWAAVTGSLGLGAAGAVRHDLPVDPAPLLGAGHPLRRRLPRRRRARCCRRSASIEVTSRKMLDLHARPVGGQPRARPGRPTSGSSTALTALVLGGAFISGCLALRRNPIAAGGDAGLLLLDHLRHAAVRRDRRSTPWCATAGSRAARGFPDPSHAHG